MSLKSRVVWFALGLGALTFFALANMGVTASGNDCGSVMSPETFYGISGSPLGDLNASLANIDCESARGSRVTWAVIAAFGAIALVIGLARIIEGTIQSAIQRQPGYVAPAVAPETKEERKDSFCILGVVDVRDRQQMTVLSVVGFFALVAIFAAIFG
jgi:hypothetical protein